MRPIRVAVVGAGLAGVSHSVALRAGAALDQGDASELELVAIASSGEERGEALRRRAGFEQWVPHWSDLLALDLDGVVIAGTNEDHADAAIAFLNEGVGVLCEKPLAGSISDAERMVAAAAASDRPALVGYSYRWASVAESLRRAISEGRIGKVLHVRGRYWADYSGDPMAPGGWRHTGPPGTGMLADVGSHVIDLAEFLVGDRLVEVRGAMLRTVTSERPDSRGNMMRVENEDLAVWGGTFGSDALGEFSVSRVTPGVGNGLAFEIIGTTGALRWDFDRIEEYEMAERSRGAALQRVFLEPEDPYVSSLAMPISGAGYGVGDMLALQARSFLAALGAPSAVSANLLRSPTFAEGLRNMRVLQAIAESAERSGAAVTVPAE